MHCETETPDALRMRLSRVFNILRENGERARAAEVAPGEDAVARLAKLAEMVDRGLLRSSRGSSAIC